MNAVEINLRSQDARPLDIAGDRDVDRRTVDRVRIDDLPVLLDAGHEPEISRNLRGSLLLLLLPLLHRGELRLLLAKRLQLPPLRVEALLLARGAVVGLRTVVGVRLEDLLDRPSRRLLH